MVWEREKKDKGQIVQLLDVFDEASLFTDIVLELRRHASRRLEELIFQFLALEKNELQVCASEVSNS